MIDRITDPAQTVTEIEDTTRERIVFMAEQLEAASNTIEMLEESMADIELAREDVGWQRIGAWSTAQFSRDGMNRNAELCRIMVLSNPLIKRGLALRHSYVWGRGVEIEARDKTATELVDVVQAYIDLNRETLFGSGAQEDLERTVGTDGNVFLAHFTRPMSGSVKVRSIPFAEISERICNPQDRDEPWYYKRAWTVVEISDDGQKNTVRREAYYPDIAYRPRRRPKFIDSIEVFWDAPVRHVVVNRPDGWDFGVGDAFAGIDWARAYGTFLSDWAKLMKALSTYAWKVTGQSKKTAGTAATEVRKNSASTGATVRTSEAEKVGQTAVMSGATLEAIPKSGATIDADSGRPLAAMVAASLGVPVTMLLGDPGVTGARATAETLDTPTVLEFKARQRLWQTVYGDSIGYAIDQAIKAPRGPLRGTVTRDEWDTEQYELAGDIDRTVEITFGDLDQVDPKVLLEAVSIAADLELVPDLVILRAALMYLPGVEDVDEILDQVTDDDGNFVPPKATAGDVAVQRFRNGEDPAEDL
jgi:hypothetical protein